MTSYTYFDVQLIRSFLSFHLASDGQELAKIQKVRVIRNEKREGCVNDYFLNIQYIHNLSFHN